MYFSFRGDPESGLCEYIVRLRRHPLDAAADARQRLGGGVATSGVIVVLTRWDSEASSGVAGDGVKTGDGVRERLETIL
jgi:hypothetical protein